MASVTSYRTQPAQISDSDSSSDDDQPWKRQKKFGASKRETPMVVSSVRESAAVSSLSTSSSFKRKRNNIWADVVQQQEEDQVTRDITQFDMYNSKERDVESYSYKIRDDHAVKQQPLGKPINYDDNNSNINRKIPEALGGSNEDAWLVDGGQDDQAGVKNRLGSRGGDDIDVRETKTYDNKMKYVKLDPDMHKAEVAGEIAYSLQEPKREMVKSVVEELGVEKTIAVWKETWDVEQNGGMMVNNGSRRRTPGGVFFQLLKTDSDIPNEKKDLIFAMSNCQSKQEGKLRRRRKRRKQRTCSMEMNQTEEDGGRREEENIHGRGEMGEGTKKEVEIEKEDEMNLKTDEEDGSGEEENIHGRGVIGEGIKKEDQDETEGNDNPLINNVDRTAMEEVEADQNVDANSEIKETMLIVKTEIKVESNDMEEGELSD